MKVRKIISILLVLCLLLSTMPLSASAATIVDRGTAEGISWKLDSEGTLTVTATKKNAVVSSLDWDYNKLQSVKKIVVSGTVKELGRAAFMSCSNLESVKLPSGLKTIGYGAFAYCSSLQKITLPNSVTDIGVSAFAYCNDLEMITLPSSLKKLEVCAFMGCYSLKAITIPKGVTVIEMQAFDYCTSLKTVKLPSGLKTIGGSVFAHCSSLETVKLPSSLKTIEGGAFKYCSSLREINLPSSLTTIGNDAFKECTSLKTVTIPKSVTSLGNEVFVGCSSLTAINVNKSNTKYTSINGVLYNKKKTELIQYPAGKSGVAVVPKSVTNIVSSAFDTCFLLEAINVDRSNTQYASVDGILYNKKKTKLLMCPLGKTGSVKIPSSVTDIEKDAFNGCSRLTSVSIPDSVKSIGEQAFWNCSSLQSVTLPKGLTVIGRSVFLGCSSLQSISIPSSVKKIDAYAFYGCSSLQTIVLPKGLTSIGTAAFIGCTRLTSIEIPAKVQKIEWSLFDLSGVKQIYFNGNAPSFDANAFKNVTATAFYPANNSTWTKSVRQNYGGNITWASDKNIVKITTHPKSTYAKNGAKATVTVKASGDGLKYTWYVKDMDEAEFKKSSATGATYSAKMTDKVHGREVYCVVKNKKGISVQSSTAVLRMAASIITQPKTAYAKSGETALVSVEAVGDEITYTWYAKNKGAEKFVKSSVTGDTYSAKMTSKTKDKQVYCVVTDKYGKTVKTNTVYLRMAATVTTQPKSVTVANNQTVKLTLKAKGDGLTYTWYVKNMDADKFVKSSVKGSTYSVTMDSTKKDRQVYCVVKDKYGKTAKSNTVYLRMAASIITQPKTVTVADNETATLTLKAAGDDLKYTWYVKNKDAESFVKSSIKGSTYSVTMDSAKKDRQVYCIVKDKYGNTVQSKTVMLKMK